VINKIFLSILAFALCGCVDLGLVGIHPELKTVYFDGNKHDVESCFQYAVFKQKMSLTVDDPLPGGTERYNLKDTNYNDVAWIDITDSGKFQTAVNFYYAPHSPDIHQVISGMISLCQKRLY